MGLTRGMFSCLDTNNPEPPNPNPKRFFIKHKTKIGELWVLLVHYPDCTTFNGNKLLVMLSEPSEKWLDPHFLESNDVIARFRPTENGMKMALHLCNAIKLTCNKEQ